MRKDMNVAVLLVVVIVCTVILLLYGTINGYFTAAPNYCKDSDGKNFYETGTTELFLMLEEDVPTNIYKDYCSDQNTVVEHFCVWEDPNYAVEQTEQECEMGCKDGACVRSETRMPRIDILSRIYGGLKNMF